MKISELQRRVAELELHAKQLLTEAQAVATIRHELQNPALQVTIAFAVKPAARIVTREHLAKFLPMESGYTLPPETTA